MAMSEAYKQEQESDSQLRWQVVSPGHTVCMHRRQREFSPLNPTLLSASTIIVIINLSSVCYTAQYSYAL